MSNLTSEEENYHRLVEFYRKELLQLHRGKPITEIFTQHKQSTLYRRGVTLRVYGKPNRVHPDALKILGVKQ